MVWPDFHDRGVMGPTDTLPGKEGGGEEEKGREMGPDEEKSGTSQRKTSVY